MTTRETLINSAVQWLYIQYPDELPEAEIKPALKMCADMFYHIRDVRKANAYLNALYPDGKGEQQLIRDVRRYWLQRKMADLPDYLT